MWSSSLLPLKRAVLSIHLSCIFLCATAFSCLHRFKKYIYNSYKSELDNMEPPVLILGQKTCSVFHSSHFLSNTWKTLNSFSSRSQFWLDVNNERKWEDRSERWMNESWREKIWWNGKNLCPVSETFTAYSCMICCLRNLVLPHQDFNESDMLVNRKWHCANGKHRCCTTPSLALRILAYSMSTMQPGLWDLAIITTYKWSFTFCSTVSCWPNADTRSRSIVQYMYEDK